MFGLKETAVLIELFALRLGVPLAVTILLCWWLRRIDAKWQAEAEAYREQSTAGQRAAEDSEQGQDKPCWLVKKCPEARYRECAAFRLQDLPCWLARLRTDGRLPDLCSNCALFRSRVASTV